MITIFETDDASGAVYDDETFRTYTLEIGDTFQGTLKGETFGADPEDYGSHGFDSSDMLRFSIKAGDTIAFDAMYLSGDYVSDVSVALFDDEGTLIQRPDKSSIGNGETYTFLEGGTYYAGVSIWDIFDSGTYEFTLNYAETPENVDFVTPLYTLEDTLSELGEKDYFAVFVEERTKYRILIEEVSDTSGFIDGADPFNTLIRGKLVLTNSSGEIVASTGDNPDEFSSSLLLFTAEKSEELTLEVSSRFDNSIDFDTGDYRIVFDRIDTLRGTAIDDVIIGTANNETIYGLEGNDIVEASSGDDIVDSGEGEDSVSAISGRNEIKGGDGDDFIVGGFDDDAIFGGDGNDILVGDNNALVASADSLTGGAGDDLLAGGGGADTFVFGTNDGNDVIGFVDIDFDDPTASSVSGTDFEHDIDTVLLDGFGYADTQAALTHMTDVDGVAVFSDQGTTITFAGLTAVDFTADDFQIL